MFESFYTIGYVESTAFAKGKSIYTALNTHYIYKTCRVWMMMMMLIVHYMYQCGWRGKKENVKEEDENNQRILSRTMESLLYVFVGKNFLLLLLLFILV